MGGPEPLPSAEPHVPWQGEVGRHPQPVKDIDYEQPAVLYNKVMTDEDRDHLITNIANHMNNGVEDRIKLRSVVMFWKMDEDCGGRIARAVNIDPELVKQLADMSFPELVKATGNR